MDFIFGFMTGFWGWALFVVLMIGLLSYDRWFWATVSTVVILGASFWATRTQPIEWGTVALYAGYYVAVGLIFTFVKWWFYVRKNGRVFKEADRVNRAKGDAATPAYKFAQTWTNNDLYGIIQVRSVGHESSPSGFSWKVTYVKKDLVGRVTLWAIYWPVYAALIIIEDFFKEMINWFVDTFGGVYQRILNSAYN